MSSTDLYSDLPDYLRHSDQDTPVPTWQQVTRSVASPNFEMIAQIARLITGTDDEQAAQAVWDSWPGNYQRSLGLLVDKIFHEGWLDSVGQIKGWPWDGGFFFWPRESATALADAMASKSGKGGAYTESNLRSGLFAYLNSWSHKGWRRSWMENDSAMAALHVGIFDDGSAEVHLDAFNSLYTNGAPRADLIRLPLAGSFNLAMYRLHRRWDQSAYGPTVRTSANFYYMMRGSVPLSF